MAVKQFLKKFNFAVLPLVIWGIMILYHTLVYPHYLDFMYESNMPFWLEFVLNTLIQMAIVCTITAVCRKILGLEIKECLYSVPVMDVLFLIYSPPTSFFYFFPGLFGRTLSWLASMFFTVQYTVFILITVAIANVIRYDNARTAERETPNDGKP